MFTIDLHYTTIKEPVGEDISYNIEIKLPRYKSIQVIEVTVF